jgi:outer membrane lipase/esterase
MSVGNGPRHRRKASQLKLRLSRVRDSGADHSAVPEEGYCAAGPRVDHVLRFLALSAAVVVSSPAVAQSINQFVGFGDSTIDSGWYRNNIVNGQPFAGGGSNFNILFPDAVKEGAGRATSSPGLMSSELLAGFFGTTARPANDPNGGTNYATSGARNNQVNNPGDGLFTQAVPTVTQINNYLSANGGVANPNALYLISSGGNNIDFALDNLPANQRTAYVTQAAKDEIAAVVKLKAAGARYIIIPNLSAAPQGLRATYNETLWNGLAAAGVNFIPADFNSLRRTIVDNPVAFGFTPATVDINNPACKAVLPNVDAAALLCATSKAPLVEPNADQTHLFADTAGHFATKGQKIYADYLYSLVIAPSEISLLAENPVKSRAATIDLIMNQIPISQRTRGPLGFNVWASGDLSRLQIDRSSVGFVGESATPTQVMAGIDTMTSGGILLGMAVSAGTKKASFSQGGSFTQDEFAVSGYTAATLGPLWLNMIGSFGALHYDVNRVVPLGPVLEQNNTTTNGTNLSFSVRTGHNTVVGPVTFGPVIGLTLQSVHIDGFTESGNVTSLAFSDQYRHSSLGVLGYQASFDFGRFQPFAKVLWNHEFVSHDRLVTATLTSTVAPSYSSLPAVNLGKDWASATAGVSVGLGKGVTGLVSFTGQIGQDKVTNYGGQFGLNVAF